MGTSRRIATYVATRAHVHTAIANMCASQMAQVDLVNMLCAAKVGGNPESTVGLLSMAGRSSRILVTSTRDLGQVFTCMHDVKMDGTSDIVSGIQKAQLALKHRQNMMQRQRIVVFVSSPIEVATAKLVALAKKLKKNSVAVDIVNIGNEGDNEEKVNAFIEAVNNNENSNALHIPSTTPNIADTFMSSAVYLDRDAQAATPAAAAGGGGGDGGNANEFPFGVDPAQDPELAMVLRMSMEEERLRLEQLARAEKEGSNAAKGSGSASDSKKENGDGDYDDDDDLYNGGEKDKMEVENAAAPGADGDEEMDEETRRAIELSMTDYEAPKEEDKDKS